MHLPVILKKHKKLTVFLCILLCLILLLGLFLFRFVYGCPSIQTMYYGEKGAVITPESITLDLVASSAGLNFTGYEVVSYEDGTLVLRFYGGIPMPWMEYQISASAYPIPNHYPDLKRICLRGRSDKRTRLIWTLEDGPLKDGPPQYIE